MNRQPIEIHVQPSNGSVVLTGLDVVLEDRMLISKAKSELENLIFSERDMGTGYLWINLENLLFGGQKAGLNLCFKDGVLEMITFGVALPSDEECERWPTEETSMRHVAFMRKILENQLGCKLMNGTAKFSWGAAWSTFDPKGFMASAGLHYAR